VAFSAIAQLGMIVNVRYSVTEKSRYKPVGRCSQNDQLLRFLTPKSVGNPLDVRLCVSGLIVLTMSFQNLVSDWPYLFVNPGYKNGKSGQPPLPHARPQRWWLSAFVALVAKICFPK
jgi:hypothetical protein